MAMKTMTTKAKASPSSRRPQQPTKDKAKVSSTGTLPSTMAADSTATVASAKSTRVCIKNLPKTCTSDELKEFLISTSKQQQHQQQHPSNDTVLLQITDCKVLMTADKKRSRRIAFVGFKSVDMAQHVLQFFHKTYLRSSRLIVEPASSIIATTTTSTTTASTSNKTSKKDIKNNKTQAPSLDGESSSNNVDGTKSGDNNDKNKNSKLERQKEEFLALMGVGRKQENDPQGGGKSSSTSKTKFWSNDDIMMTATQQGNMEVVDAKTTQDVHGNANNNNSDDDDDSSSSSSSSSSTSDGSSSSLDEEETGKDGVDEEKVSSGTNQDSSKMKTNITEMSDRDFFKSKQRLDIDDLDDDDANDKDGGVVNDEDDNEKIGNDDNSSTSSSSSSSDSNDDSSTCKSSGYIDNVGEKGGNDDSVIDGVNAPNDIENAQESMDVDDNDRSVNRNDVTEEGDDDDEPTSSGESKRLFVRNLPFSTTEEELHEYFETCGGGGSGGENKILHVTDCHIPVDDRKRNKGFAFVTFSSIDDAWRARTELDKCDFQGRLLHILPARPAPSSTIGIGLDDKNLTWKQKQELARKQRDIAESGGNSATNGGKTGWSSSFVRGDAVVDHLADRLGLRNDKGKLLNVKDGLSSGDAAVRLALGETQIIQENRDYFASYGIDMDTLVSSTPPSSSSSSSNATASTTTTKRSTTSFLVKNLPYDTTVEELTKLFHFGAGNNEGDDDAMRILLPPSRTIALVEYSHSSDAKKAFRKMAYRRFKHVPIYLEWAPLASKISGTTDESAKTSNSNVKNDNSDKLGSQEGHESRSGKQNIDQDDDDEDATANLPTTIYVKNLNFRTTEETLRQVFERCGRVRSVRIPQKVAPAMSSRGTAVGDDIQGPTMSMGFGFVELDSNEALEQSMKKLQGKLVDGHSIELKRSGNRSRNIRGDNSGTKKKSTKLLVKNVPFQATRKELVKLFGSFGQLRSVRLPKKFDGSHRGFGFVEYLTNKDAMESMKALSSTHLYGRHLVIEWASNTDQDGTAQDENSNEKVQQHEKSKRASGTISIASTPKNKKIRLT